LLLKELLLGVEDRGLGLERMLHLLVILRLELVKLTMHLLRHLLELLRRKVPLSHALVLEIWLATLEQLLLLWLSSEDRWVSKTELALIRESSLHLHVLLLLSIHHHLLRVRLASLLSAHHHHLLLLLLHSAHIGLLIWRELVRLGPPYVADVHLLLLLLL
jgi:hypothetical protein